MASYGQASTPYGGRRSPYFDATANYGSPWGGADAFLGTPLGQSMEETDLNAAWTRFIGRFAGGNDPFSLFVQGQRNKVFDNLDAARLTNPNLTNRQYLQGLGGYEAFAREFAKQSPAARGERWSTFAPRTRLSTWAGSF